jgi:hypothetical protein
MEENAMNPDTSSIPVACDLSQLTFEQREREKSLLGWFRSHATNPTETEEGFTCTFDASSETLIALGELMALERLCCPFLSFRLEVSAASSATLHLLGRGAAREIIAKEFIP